MILSIRQGVFETNSSSTHSLTMVDEDDFELFKKGGLLYSDDIWNHSASLKTSLKKPFCTWEEACDYMDRIGKGVNNCTPEEALEALLDEGFKTYKELIENEEELEVFIDTYVSKSGDRIVAFGMYGYS